jgi:hypothetical protein
MFTLQSFLSGVTRGPFVELADLLSLPPDRLRQSMALLGAFMVACELVRVALGNTLVHSRLAHVVRCMLTFAVQATVLAGVLVYSAIRHPERAWTNLLVALLLYGVWYATGRLTTLARSDSEGADPGFMTVGALITFPAGVLAAILA